MMVNSLTQIPIGLPYTEYIRFVIQCIWNSKEQTSQILIWTRYYTIWNIIIFNKREQLGIYQFE